MYFNALIVCNNLTVLLMIMLQTRIKPNTTAAL